VFLGKILAIPTLAMALKRTEGAIGSNAKREAHQAIVDHLEKHMPPDM